MRENNKNNCNHSGCRRRIHNTHTHMPIRIYNNGDKLYVRGGRAQVVICDERGRARGLLFDRPTSRGRTAVGQPAPLAAALPANVPRPRSRQKRCNPCRARRHAVEWLVTNWPTGKLTWATLRRRPCASGTAPRTAATERSAPASRWSAPSSSCAPVLGGRIQ